LVARPLCLGSAQLLLVWEGSATGGSPSHATPFSKRRVHLVQARPAHAPVCVRAPRTPSCQALARSPSAAGRQRAAVMELRRRVVALETTAAVLAGGRWAAFLGESTRMGLEGSQSARPWPISLGHEEAAVLAERTQTRFHALTRRPSPAGSAPSPRPPLWPAMRAAATMGGAWCACRSWPSRCGVGGLERKGDNQTWLEAPAIGLAGYRKRFHNGYPGSTAGKLQYNLAPRSCLTASYPSARTAQTHTS
jgi:hypothetical protein